MDPDRISRAVSRLTREEIHEFRRACDLFERAGIWTPEEARAWREAVRARAAELSVPVAEA